MGFYENYEMLGNIPEGMWPQGRVNNSFFFQNGMFLIICFIYKEYRFEGQRI